MPAAKSTGRCSPRCPTPTRRSRSSSKALDEPGYHAGAVDGLYGPATSEALTAFQRDHGPEPTGHLDGPTIEELERRNDHIEHPLVEAMQTQLTELGAYSGMVDGIWGPESDAAIAAFQQARVPRPPGGSTSSRSRRWSSPTKPG